MTREAQVESRVLLLNKWELQVERFRLPVSARRGKFETLQILHALRPWVRPFCTVKWVDV